MSAYKSYVINEAIFEELNGAYWDWSLLNNHVRYSKSISDLFEFGEDEMPGFLALLQQQIVAEDLVDVINLYHNHINSKGAIPFVFNANFKVKHNKIKPLFCKAKVIEWGANNTPLHMIGCFFESIDLSNIDSHLNATDKTIDANIKYNSRGNMFSHLLSEQSSEMAKLGGWEYLIKEKKIIWSKEVYDIYELPVAFTPNLDGVIEPYLAEHRILLLKAIDDLTTNKKSYDLELVLQTPTGSHKWTRCMGRPILNEQKQVIGLRGAVQDINDMKLKEIAQQQSIEIINDQNKRLRNFAHIVSHNLRSHSGNMSSLLSLLKYANSEAEKQLFIDNLEKISHSLNQTINHLGEVVRIQIDVNKVKHLLRFEDVLNNIKSILNRDIDESGAQIYADFSQSPEINYVTAYLESIMQNLISNAIKYKHPQRNPEIHITTIPVGNTIEMTVKDNGIGIDLNKHKDKLFGMYKTFHQHPDARGIGLFITKNQIEALGGNISVTSQPGTGTIFKIQF